MRLMVVIALVINVFLALTLLFFRATRKTYPGFGLWTTGVSLLGLGYLSWCLRGSVPDSISILVVNAAFPLGMVFHLAAMRRFLRLTPMPLLWYALPGGAVAAAAVFYYGYDSIVWRGLIVSIAISAPHFAMALLILRQPVRSRSMFYGVIGTLMALAGVMILARAMWLLRDTQFQMFWDSPVEFIFLVSVVVLQLGETLAFIMLNTERVEIELVEAESELRTTVARLQEASASQKLVEESLRESEEKFRDLFNNAGVGMFRSRLDGSETLDVNDKFLKILNQTREGVLGKPSVVLWADPREREEMVRRLNTEGQVNDYEYRMLTSHGEVRNYLTSVRLYPENEILEGSILDITDRKKAEAALRESEEKHRTILASIEEGYFEVDIAGSITFCNESLSRMHGYTKEEFIGVNNREYMDADNAKQVYNAFNRVYCTGKPEGMFGYEIVRKDGVPRDVEASVSLIKDSEGAPRGFRGIVRDITERKKAEEEREQLRNQLVQSQKMEAIGTLTGGIAHDFNNLLTIMNGYTEMILMDKTEDDPLYADLQKILQTGLKGADMVQRLLSFTKQSATKPEPMDLNHRIEETKKLLDRTFPKTIEIETNLPDDLEMVNADAGQMDQLLLNLCVNAKDAMPDGGRLRIETRNITVDEDYCSLHVGASPGRYVVIEVSDTGIGMSKETMDRMFDPFFTTKGWDFKKGTGLGLSVAKGIVEQHRGWITCESEAGKGTTFTVYFPVIKDSPVVEKPDPIAESVPGNEKILLVDDEEYVRDLGKRILERAGYTVITAANGKDALAIYAKEQSSIALVVLDLIMPQMEGKRCLEELLKINPHVKVIVSTGHALDARESLLLGVLARGFVNKPYEVGQMVQTVKGVLKAGGPAE